MSSANRIIEQDIQAICTELTAILRPLSGTTLLVTGGSGFLCSYLLDTVAYLNDHVFDSPCRVIGVDNLRSGLSQRTAHLAGVPNFASSTLMCRGPWTLRNRFNASFTAQGSHHPPFIVAFRSRQSTSTSTARG